MFSPSDLRQWDFAISHRGGFMSRHSKGDTAAPFGNFNLQLPNHSPYEETPSETLQGFTTKSRSFPLHKLVSSNKPTRYASAASWRATEPPSTPSVVPGPALLPPRQIQTCSTWPSLYREPHSTQTGGRRRLTFDWNASFFKYVQSCTL